MAGRPIPVRLEDELLGRIDRVVSGLSLRAEGVGITRSAVLRAALDRGLTELEGALEPPARPSSPAPAPRPRDD